MHTFNMHTYGLARARCPAAIVLATGGHRVHEKQTDRGDRRGSRDAAARRVRARPADCEDRGRGRVLRSFRRLRRTDRRRDEGVSEAEW